MGLLFKRTVQHGTGAGGGGGGIPTPRSVTASVATTSTTAKTPSPISPGVIQSRTLAVAISNSIAKTAVGNTISGAQIVNTTPALTSSTPIGLKANRNIGAPVATSVSTAKTPSLNTGALYNPTTGAGIMNTDPAAIPIFFDAAELYTSDADWKSKKVWYGLGLNPTPGPFAAGTKTGSNLFPTTLYGDGRYPDQVGRVAHPDASFGPAFDEPCFEWIIPPNAGTGILRVYIGSSTIYQTLNISRRAYCSTPQFTPTGDNPAKTGAASYKKGMFNGYNDGRAGVITDGNVPPNLILSNGWSPANGFTEIIAAASAPSTFYNGVMVTTATMVEQFIEGGIVYTANSYYEKADGSSTWVQIGPRIVGYTALTSRHPVASWTVMHENYNQIRLTNLKCWSSHVAAFDLDVYPDAAGIVAQMAAQTPVNPTSIASVSGTSTTMNATVGIGRYTGYIRFKIDGTFLVGKDYQLKKREDEIIVTDYATPTAGTAAIALTGLSLASGSHTVQAYAVSKNGTVLSAGGPSTSFSV